MDMDLSVWKGGPRPERITLEGRYVRIEPLDPRRHGDDLYAATMAPGVEERLRYLTVHPPAWLEDYSSDPNKLAFATIDKRTNRAEGRQALRNIDPVHGVIEVAMMWGPAIARTRVATEAVFLFASYVFDELAYRRFVWRANNLNEPSKRAATRFGFVYEGVLRQLKVIKAQNFDAACYAMLDADWLRLKPGYERWLCPRNFDEDGTQKTKLKFD
ncbi:unnamed protein product [Bemisia tabaci]|uniref:N-acetyltransferase domain-containing protein n=1 Tax=Bemisia tabaci TaxID=7038 RepID=A0A9P0F6J9_BEMTA|nr:unnamed protein product [Bemisia tabaci]